MIINKKTIRLIIRFEIVFTLVIFEIIDLFKLPNTILYILDALNIVLFIYLLASKTKKQQFILAEYNITKYSLIVLIIGIFLSDIINCVSPFLIIWAFRNSFRFLALFFSSIMVLEEEDVKSIFDLMIWIQIPNVVLTLFQYYVIGTSWDNIGGIFGTQSGCNAYSNVYFCIIVIYAITQYVNGKCTFLRLFLVCGSSLVLSTFGEIKFFYIEFVIIILICMFMTHPSLKKVSALIVSIMTFVIGMTILSAVMPDAYKFFTNFDVFMNYNNTVLSGYNINRIGAFSHINQLFFHNSILKNMFGLGFGNCEYSSITIFNSHFHDIYGGFHYRWFSHQMWFLETGYVGIILLVLFLLSVFFWGIQKRNKLQCNWEWGLFANVFSLITIINLWYNNAIRVETGYLVYFALAAPFIILKSKNKQIRI